MADFRFNLGHERSAASDQFSSRGSGSSPCPIYRHACRAEPAILLLLTDKFDTAWEEELGVHERITSIRLERGRNLGRPVGDSPINFPDEATTRLFGSNSGRLGSPSLPVSIVLVDEASNRS